MALDWIKWTKGLAKRREVVAVAHKLGVDRLVVASSCMELWEWADDNTIDGHVQGVTADYIDELVRLPGFAAALAHSEIGWLRLTQSGVTFPNFERHNGEPAKKRAMEAEKKRRQRACPADVPQMSRNLGDKTGTREEKRRVIPPDASASTPAGGSTPLGASRVSWSSDARWQGISDTHRARWNQAYPACDIDRQLSAMHVWLCANPTKAKKSNYERFITNWLSKEQDRGGDQRNSGTNRSASQTARNQARTEGQHAEHVEL